MTSRWLTAVLLSLVALPAGAGVRLLDPGAPPPKPGEGVLVVAIDTDVGSEYIDLGAVGAGFGGERFKRIGAGRHQFVLAATPATYRWGKLAVGSTFNSIWSTRYYYDLGGDPRFRCTVEAGVINYCGDLLVRSTGYGRARFAQRNRGAAALVELRRDAAPAVAAFAWRYRGRYADPFPEYWTTLTRTKAAPAVAAPVYPQATTPNGALGVEAYFRAPEVSAMHINSAGSLLLEVGYRGAQHTIELIDANSGLTANVYRGAREPVSVTWIGDARAVLEFATDGGLNDIVVIDVVQLPGAAPRHDAKPLPFQGFVIEGGSGGRHVLVARFDFSREDRMTVHRIDVSGERISALQYDRRQRLDDGVAGDYAWLADAGGTLRVAMAEHDGKHRIHYRDDAGSAYREVATVNDDDVLLPVAATAGGFYAITDRDRQYRELVRWDAAAGRIAETVLAVPGADVLGAVRRDRDGAVIGARYYERGRLRTRYIDPGMQRLQSSLDKTFPGQHVVVVGTSRDESRIVLLVESATRPPAYYLLNRAARTAELLAETLPALAETRFAAPTVLDVTTADGLELDAFLYTSAASEPQPLVIMPHGGPIGVFDKQHFDHEVQFLASRGYAVLQVNYRGSGGAGRAWREAGERGYGRAIEEDVMAALDAALATGRVDRARVAIVGASYGGYSGLRSAMRWPDRVRGVVSIAGPTDVLLQFTGSDAADDPDTQAELTRWIGDPGSEIDTLRELSPVYAPEKLTVPLLLVHGTEDERVPYEHALRLSQVLTHVGRSPWLVPIEGEGHGFERLSSSVTAYGAVERFLAVVLRASAP
jgi:dipeptidyl aminopeptidase/acylaminoacyl peptidase